MFIQFLGKNCAPVVASKLARSCPKWPEAARSGTTTITFAMKTLRMHRQSSTTSAQDVTNHIHHSYLKPHSVLSITLITQSITANHTTNSSLTYNPEATRNLLPTLRPQYPRCSTENAESGPGYGPRLQNHHYLPPLPTTALSRIPTLGALWLPRSIKS